MESILSLNLLSLRERISALEIQYGREPGSVKLIAVSKTKPVELIREAMDAGQLDFGENKVQEMADKQPQLPDLRWHQIGHLQTNKVKYIAPFVHLIHSLDSEKLAAEINRQAEKHSRIIPCLIQLNISDESQKSGLDEKEASGLIQSIEAFPWIRIEGLMGIAADTTDVKVISAQFRRLRLAAESFRPLENAQVRMNELSMGMSHDYELAIAEGATMLRIGSLIFGSR